jgi:fibronectin type 3 domain-containing protein
MKIVFTTVRLVFFVVAWLAGLSPAHAQVDSLNRDPLQVLARPGKDSIVLRWAPLKTDWWLQANKQGYIIERYTLVRNKKVLDQPDKKILTPAPMKPYVEAQWEKVAGNNKYVIIAAQALLGETFELDMQNNGSRASIVNKVTENEQRFSIALFCADMSVVAAQALGLYYVDKDVKTGEKYLYRIVSPGKSEPSSVKGSAFVSPDDIYKLTPPLKFSVEAKERIVQLQWDQSHHKRTYTTYRIERSGDGKNFKPISDDPVVSLAPYNGDETELQYAIDSLPDLGEDYYYRVKGVTPFGEEGPPSEVKTVKGIKVLGDLPHITSALSIDNKTIALTWSFPEEYNEQISGFLIERSSSPAGVFNKAHEGVLGNATRSFMDATPKQTNYYRVAAQTPDKRLLKSALYYAQLVDSVPPAVPSDMKGVIDEYGNVEFSWKPNTDPDIYGYRIYRAYYKNDEFAQLTSSPIRESTFRDKVNVESLNEKVYYRVMAIDNNQNHSSLSEIYTISLPDKVPPVSPVLLPVTSREEGVDLSWTPSSSIDVVRYDVYRKTENQWIRLSSMNATNDSVYYYTDTNLNTEGEHYYTVIAVDDASQESPPAPAVVGQKLKRSIWPAVTIQDPLLNKENKSLTLRWSYEYTDVQLYQIYKSTDTTPLKLYRSVTTKELVDRITPGKYSYKVVAVFKNGGRSGMGEGVTITF